MDDYVSRRATRTESRPGVVRAKKRECLFEALEGEDVAQHLGGGHAIVVDELDRRLGVETGAGVERDAPGRDPVAVEALQRAVLHPGDDDVTALADEVHRDVDRDRVPSGGVDDDVRHGARR